MKYEVIVNLVRRSNREIICAYRHTYNTMKEALDYILDMHQMSRDFESTYIDIFCNEVNL